VHTRTVQIPYKLSTFLPLTHTNSIYTIYCEVHVYSLDNMHNINSNLLTHVTSKPRHQQSALGEIYH